MAQPTKKPVPAPLASSPVNYGSGDFLIDVYGKAEDGVYTKDGKQWFDIPPSRDAGEVCSSSIIDLIQISTPSTGSDASYTVLDEFKMLYIRCALITDNNAGNRAVFFRIDDDSNNTLLKSRASSQQGENTNIKYNFGFGLQNHFFLDNACVHLPEIYVLKNYTIFIAVSGMENTDQLGSIFMSVLKPVIRYRFEVKGCKSFMIDAGSNTVKAYKIG